jgi:exonuclease SbcD
VPYVKVLAIPEFLRPIDLWDLPIQIIAMPWISRSGLMASVDTSGESGEEVISNIESRISDLINLWLDEADPNLPTILTAHASVQGAKFGSERMVMLGADLVLPGSLVKDERLDYVALGHIHKPQDLNEKGHHPVIYPGSIERVDFGEAEDDRYFVIASIEKGGHTKVEWRKLTEARPFIERRVAIKPALSEVEASSENVTEALIAGLPKLKDLDGAIVKLIVEYPREYDSLIDETALRRHAEKAFEFHLVKRPQTEARIRLPADQTVGSLSPLELLDQYWRASHADPSDAEALQKLAREILSDDNESSGNSL